MGIRVEPYVEGRRKADKRMMIFTLMGKDRPGIVASVSGMFSENGINIETIKMIARGEYIATEITIDTSDVPDIKSMRRMLYAFSEKSGLDVSLQGLRYISETETGGTFSIVTVPSSRERSSMNWPRWRVSGKRSRK